MSWKNFKVGPWSIASALSVAIGGPQTTRGNWRARLTRPVGRIRLAVQVLHVDHRPARGPPGREKTRNIRLGLGVVAPAPFRMVEGLLQIDDQQKA